MMKALILLAALAEATPQDRTGRDAAVAGGGAAVAIASVVAGRAWNRRRVRKGKKPLDIDPANAIGAFRREAQWQQMVDKAVWEAREHARRGPFRPTIAQFRRDVLDHFVRELDRRKMPRPANLEARLHGVAKGIR